MVAGGLLAPRALAIGSGPLGLRTSSTEGSVRLQSDHGFETGAFIDLVWRGGSRARAIVGGVVGRDVAFSGGTGDDLPRVGMAIDANGDFSILHESYREDGDAYFGLCGFGELLFVLGTYRIGETAMSCTVFDGENVTDATPRDENEEITWSGRRAIVADLGDGEKVYGAGWDSGVGQGGPCVLKRSGSAWIGVGTNLLTGTCNAIAVVDYDGTIGKRLYAVGALAVITQGVSVGCCVAELTDGVWAPIAAVVGTTQVLDCSGPKSAGQRPVLTVVGDMAALYDIQSETIVIVNNLAEYDPRRAESRWRPSVHGGVNGLALALG